MHFSIKKKPRNILKWKPAGSHLCSARQGLSLGADSAIIFFRLQHGASGPHHERTVNWYYLSSPPQILRAIRFHLESRWLMYVL
jgi:hypothetical protein